jgi:putative flippase GtrA
MLRETSLIALVREVAIPSRDSPVHIRGIRHLIANGSGTVLYIGMVASLVELLSIDPIAAVVMSVVVFEIYTYLVNRLWVHAATSDHQQAVPRFIVVTLVALGLNTGIMWLTVDVLQLPYYWALVIATLVVPPTNFLLNYLWVFRA